MKFSNKTYDVLKYLACFFLPALAVLVKTIFAIWGLPYGDEISSTIVAINAFLGACLGISSISYKQEQLEKKEQWDNL